MRLENRNIEASHFLTEVYSGKIYDYMYINAGKNHEELVIPPAGEEHSFVRKIWQWRFDISVSPTGKSTQLFINGNKINLGLYEERPYAKINI